LTKVGNDEDQADLGRCWWRRADARSGRVQRRLRTRDRPGHGGERNAANGTLTVAGTINSDAIALRLKAGAPNIVQVDAGDDGAAEFEFDRAAFTQIQVLADAGNDVIRIDQVNGAFGDETTTLDGGTATTPSSVATATSHSSAVPATTASTATAAPTMSISARRTTASAGTRATEAT
jgi:hypothetical protein